jgi:flagellar biosynthetic protein FliR
MGKDFFVGGIHLFIFGQYMILLLARFCGFFLFSPLFFKIIPIIRLGLAIGCSLVMVPLLFQQKEVPIQQPILLGFIVFKELLTGYLVGFLVSLIVEGAAFTGQLIGVLMGLSATELLDPLVNSTHPLLSRFFSLAAFTLFFALDLHHQLIQLLYQTLKTIPLSESMLSLETIKGVILAGSSLLYLILDFAFFPLVLLLSLLFIFALISRFFPIFWVGFPVQLLIGFLAIHASAHLFAPFIKNSFDQGLALLRNALSITGS